MDDVGYWYNRERIKWHLYELAKRKLIWREMNGEELDCDEELQKIINQLKL